MTFPLRRALDTLVFHSRPPSDRRMYLLSAGIVLAALAVAIFVPDVSIVFDLVGYAHPFLLPTDTCFRSHSLSLSRARSMSHSVSHSFSFSWCFSLTWDRAVASSMTSYVMPAAFYLKAHANKHQALRWYERAPAWALLVMGITLYVPSMKRVWFLCVDGWARRRQTALFYCCVRIMAHTPRGTLMGCVGRCWVPRSPFATLWCTASAIRPALAERPLSVRLSNDCMYGYVIS